MTEAPTWWWTRFFFLRLLGLIYSVGFLMEVHQGPALIGSEGLLPAHLFLDRVAELQGGEWEGFLRLPSIFWLSASDASLMLGAWVGLSLSIAVMLGLSNAIVMGILWALYMSFVHIGQTWTGYGWEILLLETGFLAIFLAPLTRLGDLDERAPPSPVVLLLLRWLAFRLMLGAGLIKLRGDPCWMDLTCLVHHYETQPNPHPLSWWLHQQPVWFHKAGVLVNHLVELIVPWFIFAPRRLRHAAGALLVAFQIGLILSGNLSFLNWLTLCICLVCFDDTWLQRLVPRRWHQARPAQTPPLPTSRRLVTLVLAVAITLLSVGPVTNLLSSEQAMNTSFDRLHLVNTYGAFGSVGKSRDEVIIQGTLDPSPGPESQWEDYELPCKPGRIDRRPCIITPYHLRLDWQIWFAAMQRVDTNPWLIHLVAKLLHGDPGARKLLAHDPFDGRAPTAVRLSLFRYRFTESGDDWWTREYRRPYLRPLRADDPALVDFMKRQGWPTPAD
jgi:hypothetical protein